METNISKSGSTSGDSASGSGGSCSESATTLGQDFPRCGAGVQLMASERYDAKRDLDPHKPARMAMWIWGADYAARGLGSMGYWDQLREFEKDMCRRAIKEIMESPDEPGGGAANGE